MFSKAVPLEKGSKKIIDAWVSYDWANSAYSLVITSAIFPIYYGSLFSEIKTIDFFGTQVKYSAMISFVTAFAFIVISVITPILSGIADYIGDKKKFMKFFVVLGSMSCIGLFWFDLSTIYLGLTFYFLTLIGFWTSVAFYNSYLPDIAYPEQQNRASARGYSMGYIGSVILLLFNLSMVMNPDFYGISGTKSEASMTAMKYPFISVGFWWLLFSQISLFYLPKGNHSNKITKDVFWNGFKELKIVLDQLIGNLRLKRFLIAFFLYSMSLQTVLLIATYFGEAEIQWANSTEKTVGLIVSILLIQIVAIFGAIITARASERFGNIPVLIIINVIWACLCIRAFYIHTPAEFYLVAGFVGMVMGGLQSLSRATYSKFIPLTKDTASFFSFYSVTEKVAIIIGMLMFGIIDQITGSMRNSILVFAAFFIAGVILLLRVPKQKD